MTTSPAGVIPEWTRGDRLRKARELTGMTTRDFAEHIGVSQKTVSDAENDKRQIRKILLNAWALGTGVPASWLDTGVTHVGGPDDGGESPANRLTGEYAHRTPEGRLVNVRPFVGAGGLEAA